MFGAFEKEFMQKNKLNNVKSCLSFRPEQVTCLIIKIKYIRDNCVSIRNKTKILFF